MCQHCAPGGHPINCIIPPHMMDVMEMRGDAKMRKMVDGLRAISERVREERHAHAAQRMNRDADTPTSAFVTPALSVKTAAPACYREVHDGKNRAALPGDLARKEGDEPVGDAAVDDAYDYAGAVYDLYFTEFNRNSLDGLGMKLVQTVHHRRNYNNAFWNGEQMTYGDGDGEVFRTFIEPSVVGHEMTHGVVQFSGGLVYRGQSGALNESISDVFGAMVLQYMEQAGVCDTDWLIGRDILGPEINGVALRSMKAPGTAYSDALLGQDPQPYHMDFYVDTTDDNGGVHINSGIPNHAFYLYCQYMGGNSWEKPGQIWYDALQRINNPLATFHDWAAQTVSSAMGLHGLGSLEVNLLRRAWKLVGIQV